MSHILLVDDCPVDTELMLNALSGRSGWFVSTASDGMDALEMLAAAPFDVVVVSDIQMSCMDGLALLEKMRLKNLQAPVVVTTCHGNEAIALQTIRAGEASYVRKTHLQNELPEALESVLSNIIEKRNEERLMRCVTLQQLQITLPDNDRKFVPSVVQYLQHLAQSIGLTDPTDNMQLGVTLEEALVNAIVHGNLEISSELKLRDDNSFADAIEHHRMSESYKDRVVTIDVSLTPEEGRFVIMDEGPGFDVDSLPNPLDPENLLKPSGRGMMLIHAFMDSVEFNDAGNQICLIKKRKTEASKWSQGKYANLPHHHFARAISGLNR